MDEWMTDDYSMEKTSLIWRALYADRKSDRLVSCLRYDD
jgi:hypothetical protein